MYRWEISSYTLLDGWSFPQQQCSPQAACVPTLSDTFEHFLDALCNRTTTYGELAEYGLNNLKFGTGVKSTTSTSNVQPILHKRMALL